MAETSCFDVTQEAGRALMQRPIVGPVLMFNLLRLRAVTDYSADPSLAPAAPIGGAVAYDRYIAHTLPLLRKSGDDILFQDRGGPFLIGPAVENWDLAALIRQARVADFVAFASDMEYLSGMGHRTAAVVDARLLPLEPMGMDDAAMV